MRTFGIVVFVVASFIGIAVAWCKITYPTYTYRYRMTVEVEVDDKLRSGSSVIQVRLSKQPQFLPEVPPVSESVLGEAVFVDLGNGRNVIALLASGPNGANVGFPQHVVPGLHNLSYNDNDLVKFPKLRGSWDLPPERMPTLVTFTDLNDPKTARVVRPEEFEEVFGPAVSFKRVWIEMTKQPVTRGIEKRLSFLGPMREAQKDKSVLVYPGKLNIVPPLFVRG